MSIYSNCSLTKKIGGFVSSFVLGILLFFVLLPLNVEARDVEDVPMLRGKNIEFVRNGSLDVSDGDRKNGLTDVGDYPIVVYPVYNGDRIKLSDPIATHLLMDSGFGFGMAGTDASTYLYIVDDYIMDSSEFDFAIDAEEVQTDVYDLFFGVTPTSTYPVNSFSFQMLVLYQDNFVYSLSSLIPDITTCSTASQCIVEVEIAPHKVDAITQEVAPSADLTVEHDNSALTSVSGYYETLLTPVQNSSEYAMTDVQSLNTSTYTFNPEGGPFYQDASNAYLQEMKGGEWQTDSLWLDSDTRNAMSFNAGTGFSMCFANGVTNVLMSASGAYSGVWGDEITITGNGFGDIGESVSGAGTVSIDGQNVTVLSWSETAIEIRIPQGDIDASNQSGVPVSITRSDGETRVVDVIFDNTDDSPAGTEQTTDLNAANVPNDNGNVITLDFSASNDDTSANHNEEVMEYRIYRYAGTGPDHGNLPIGSGDFVQIGVIDATGAANYSFTDNSVPTNGTDYTYYIIAVDKNGNMQPVINQGNMSIAQAIDETIDELELSLDPGDEIINVSWNHDNEGGDVTYTICYSTNSDLLQGGPNDMTADTTCVVTDGSSATFEDLVNGTRYYVRGYADDGEGNISITDIYYVDLEANLPESSIVGEVIADIPTSLRIFASMILVGLVASFANMSLIKKKVAAFRAS